MMQLCSSLPEKTQHPVDAQPIQAFAGHPKMKAPLSVPWVTCLCTLDDDCVCMSVVGGA